MSRQIIIDEDTRVGYTFEGDKYYVINKETATYRSTPTQILKVVNIVDTNKDLLGNPLDESNLPITVSRLNLLKETLEPLTALYHTLSSTGEYIETIQLNTYYNNPIAIDLTKNKIYIMNTNIIYDLSLNEPKGTRVLAMKDYYKRHLGVDVSVEDLTIIYDLLASYYNPHPYNKIESSTTPLTYSSTIDFSNRDNSSNITYTLLGNPNSKFTIENKNYISNINSNRVIKLLETPIDLSIGDKIEIGNATTYIEDTSYTSNGTYTISAIEDNLLKVLETIAPYSTTYKTCYLKQPILTIESANRNTNTITLTNTVPNSIVVGDTIHVSNTTQTIDLQEVSIDGEYTIYSITDNNIVTEETIPTDYTPIETSIGDISKHLSLGDIVSIKDKVITVTGTIPTGIEELHIVIEDKIYTVSSTTNDTITVLETIENYVPNYATLGVSIPYEEVKATVTTSDKEELPTGEFILDTYQSTIDYLTLGTTNVPTLTNFQSMSKKVPTTYTLEGCSIESTTLLGLYSSIYST